MIESIILLVLLVGLLITSMKRPKNFPPGPILLPLIGNVLTIDHYDPQISWRSIYQKYGDVVGFLVPKFTLIVVNGWDAIKEALANEDLNGRPDVCLLRDRFDGGRFGIVFQDGPIWRTQRRFALHHFRNLGFGRKSHEYVILEEIEGLVAELNDLKGKSFSIEEKFTLSAINITWCLLGGKRYQRSNPLLTKLATHVRESMHSVKTIGSPAVMFPFLRYILPSQTGYTQIKRGSKGIIEFVKETISDHINSNNEDGINDFIGIYLKQMNENPDGDKSFSLEQLEGICMDLLSAGADTSTSVLSFAILFLCKNETMQEKIAQEVCNLLGSERMPTIEDRPNLIYTDAFLHETLRFRTVTPTLPPHRCLRDTTLAGYDIPKDAILALNFESILMEESYWGDPEVFRPERFITEEGKLKKEERLISFGKGKRSCLGEMLAKMTIFLIFSSIVQKFHFRFSEGGEPKNTNSVPGFTYAAPEYKITVTPRSISKST